MPEIRNPTVLYRVDLLEFERGWGSRLDEVKYFSTEQEATDYVKEFNSENTEDVVPDWYMIAIYQGRSS